MDSLFDSSINNVEKPLPFSAFHNFPSLSIQKQKHLEYEAKIPALSHPFQNGTTLVGIEIEVENIRYQPILNFYWTAKADGSLRNNGVEFTSIPLRTYQVPYAIDYLKRQLQAENTPVFSSRCSIHVHLNTRDFTWPQLKCLLLLYAIFEKHFFNVAGTKREEGIFCVPLYKGDLLVNFDRLEETIQNWPKYSALNLGPVIGSGNCPAFGTVEFRHLYGTLNEQRLMSWINSICKLREASYKENLPDLIERISHMNTTSEYIHLYRQVFQEEALVDLVTKKDFESCIAHTKASIFRTNMANRYAPLPNSALKQTSKSELAASLAKKINASMYEVIINPFHPAEIIQGHIN